MKLNKKVLIAGTSLALSVIGLWLIFKKPKPKSQTITRDEPNDNDNPINTNPNPTPTPSSRNDNFPLKKGSYGARVKELQLVLLRYDINSLPKYGVDGGFGTETENALFKITEKRSVDTQSELDALKYSKSTFSR
jgi:hypothetical protein